MSKWVIYESLWPEHDPHKAEQNLHTTVFRMKKTLLESGLSIKKSGRFNADFLLQGCFHISQYNVRYFKIVQVQKITKGSFISLS